MVEKAVRQIEEDRADIEFLESRKFSVAWAAVRGFFDKVVSESLPVILMAAAGASAIAATATGIATMFGEALMGGLVNNVLYTSAAAGSLAAGYIGFKGAEEEVANVKKENDRIDRLIAKVEGKEQSKSLSHSKNVDSTLIGTPTAEQVIDEVSQAVDVVDAVKSMLPETSIAAKDISIASIADRERGLGDRAAS